MLLPKADIFMGPVTARIVSKNRTKDSVVNEVTSSVQIAY